MAYTDYEWNNDDTFYGIATYYGITVSELLKINNIGQPAPYKPSLIPNLSTTIQVPEIYSGNESFENSDREFQSDILTQTRAIQIRQNKRDTSDVQFGRFSDKQCRLVVSGIGTAYFPCFPEDYSDDRQSNVSSQNIIGRSEPFQIYQNSGPRTVGVSFKMHREMSPDPTWDLDKTIAIVQSATYPLSYSAPIIPKVTLYIGNACKIEGIISGSVGVTWSDTINTNYKYNVATVNFTVTECTGNPKNASTVASANAR